MVSRHGLGFGNLMVLSAFCRWSVSLAFLSLDLQHSLDRFAAEWELIGIRVSPKSEAMVPNWKKVKYWDKPLPEVEFEASESLIHEWWCDGGEMVVALVYCGKWGAELKCKAFSLQVHLCFNSRPWFLGMKLKRKKRSNLQTAKWMFFMKWLGLALISWRSPISRGISLSIVTHCSFVLIGVNWGDLSICFGRLSLK